MYRGGGASRGRVDIETKEDRCRLDYQLPVLVCLWMILNSSMQMVNIFLFPVLHQLI